MPPAYAEGDPGPLIVKCHSKMLSSSGSAWYSDEGETESSEASFTVPCEGHVRDVE
jgi:hypothetical protein